MAATTNLMADVEGVDMQDDPENIKNDFNYHNNVNGATKHIRLGFLRKVYSLLGVQLILTTVIAAACMFTPQIKGFVHENPWMLLLAFVSSMGLLMALHVKRRESPVNLILLAAFVSLENIFHDIWIVKLKIFMFSDCGWGLYSWRHRVLLRYPCSLTGLLFDGSCGRRTDLIHIPNQKRLLGMGSRVINSCST